MVSGQWSVVGGGGRGEWLGGGNLDELAGLVIEPPFVGSGLKMDSAEPQVDTVKPDEVLPCVEHLAAGLGDLKADFSPGNGVEIGIWCNTSKPDERLSASR